MHRYGRSQGLFPGRVASPPKSHFSGPESAYSYNLSELDSSPLIIASRLKRSPDPFGLRAKGILMRPISKGSVLLVKGGIFNAYIYVFMLRIYTY